LGDQKKNWPNRDESNEELKGANLFLTTIRVDKRIQEMGEVNCSATIAEPTENTRYGDIYG
jgi:hypothetical protein